MSEAQEAVAEQGARPAEAPADNQAITPVTYTGSAAVLDPIERVLTELEVRHKNVVFDLTTTKGDKAARQARKELVQVRTGAAAAYKAWNAPILDEQRKARERVKEIEDRVSLLELPIDAQIKADEARREQERLERERIEQERVAKIRERITNINSLPTLAVDMGSEDIAAVLDDLDVLELTVDRFGEFLDEATATTARVREKLVDMRNAAARREEQAEQMRLQQEALAQQQRQIAEAQAKLEQQRRDQEAEANRLRILQEEQQRQAADKAARDAEDARRAQAGQTDAFPEEKRQALDVVQADIQERRASVAAAAPAPAPAPVAAPAPQQDPVDVVARANAAADEAMAQERDEVVDADVPPFFDTTDAGPWAPSAADIVDMVADVQGVNAAQALAWLQAIDFKSVTVESLSHGQ